MESPVAHTHSERFEQLRTQYHAAVNSGRVIPYRFQHMFLGHAILVAYLMVPQQRFPVMRYARFPLFAFIIYYELSVIRSCRAVAMELSFGFMIGFHAAVAICWSAALMLWSDPQRQFSRLRRRPKGMEGGQELGNGSVLNRGNTTAADCKKARLGEQARRTVRHVMAQSAEANGGTEKTAMSDTSGNRASHSKNSIEYYWQPFPLHSLSERFWWVLELASALRGIGWNWQVPGLSSPIPGVEDQLDLGKMVPSKDAPYSTGPNGNRTYHSRTALLRHHLAVYAVGYWAVDILTAIMKKDAYFRGFIDSPPPDYLPLILRSSAVAVRAYRISLSFIIVLSNMQNMASFLLVLAVGILGQKYGGNWGEPWAYPDLFGSARMVLEKGLRGFWGGTWHQLLRVILDAPFQSMSGSLGLNKSSTATKMLRLAIVFAISGLFHAAGSYTQAGPTNPVTGMFAFFALQPIGIGLEMLAEHFLKRLSIAGHCPRMLRWCANLTYVLLWAYCTVPLALDDAARGGYFLQPAVLVSAMSKLGY